MKNYSDEDLTAMGFRTDKELHDEQRIQRDEEHKKKVQSARAWARLCGMAGPIGKGI